MANYIVQFRGQISPGTLGEIFTHRLAIQSAAAPSAVAGQVATQWKNQWGTGISGLGGMFRPTVQYDEVTCAEILKISGGTPPVVAHATHYPFTPVLTGGATDPQQLPSQSAIAVSITGGVRPNGSPAKGRFYLPPPASAKCDPDGQLTTANRDSICTIMQTLFNVLNLNGDVVSLWSAKWGVMQTLTTVRVGNKIDTIRSRRNAAAEQYKALAITGPQ